ncbi:MAG TPA: hypothetical protein VJA87_00280 [Candidatus Paceibacterota bacterium]
MEVTFTHEQFRELLELVHIGTSVRNSVFEDIGELDAEDSALECTLYGIALDEESTDVEECEHGFPHLSADLEEGCHYIIESFGENYFWSEFAARLEEDAERRTEHELKCMCG